MGTEVINANFDVLQEELDKAKSTLKGLNDNIRRINGREPSEQLRGDRKRPNDRRNDRDRNSEFGAQNESRNRNNIRGGNERDRERERERERDRERDNSPPAKRKADTKSVFSRLSGPSSHRERDDDPKPKLSSRVIRELPTKEEIVEAQGSDPASRARNRRMFGSLLGTLQKFCLEESRLRQKEQKKAQIEKKLEEQQNQEREVMKKERQDLYNNRKRQQMEIKMLENKMNLMKEFSAWEDSKKPLMNFVRTKTKPRIYYMPKVMDKRLQRKLDECKHDIEKQIEKRRAEVNEEMADIVHRFEAAVESFPITAESQNDTALNDTSMNQSHIDRSEDDSYYRCDFKSSVVKSNDRSDKRGDKSPNADDDENDASSNDDSNNKHYTKTNKEIKIEKVDAKETDDEDTNDSSESNANNTTRPNDIDDDEDNDDNDNDRNGNKNGQKSRSSRSPSQT